MLRVSILTAAVLAGMLVFPLSRARGADDDNERCGKLGAIADHDETVMVPMRDGVRLATDIYKPKNCAGKIPTVF